MLDSTDPFRPTPTPSRLRHLGRRALVGSGLALFAGACGGGGGGGSSLSVGFTESGSTASEGTSASLVLELRTGGGMLPEDVTVELTDAGTGTATSGTDYTAQPPQTITFPAGSEHLDTITVTVPLVDDSLVEGADESVVLELGNASQGLKVRDGGRHTLTVAEQDRATLEFTAGSTVTVDESTATYTATIALALDPGDILGTSVSVVVSDGGSGTATPGTDYDTFAEQTLTFAAGTSDGASQDVSLTVRDDTDSEFHETAILELSGASGGVDLGTNAAHVLTITEDDASPDPFLISMGDDTPGGSLVALDTGEARDFGAQTLDAGPGTAVRIELTNAGLMPMDLSSLTLTGDTRDFRIETQLGSSPPLAGLGAPTADASLAPVPLRTDAPLAAPVGVAFVHDPALSTALLGEQALVLDGLVTPAGEVLELAVGRRPLPIAEDAVLYVDGAPAPGGFERALEGVSIWSGQVLDAAGSEVFLALGPAGLQGWVRFGEDRDHETLHLVPSAEGSLVVVAEDSDLAALSTEGGPATCLGSLSAPDSTPAQRLDAPPGTGDLGAGVSLASCRLALETDFHFYEIFGDETLATTYATQLVAALSDTYQRDVQTSFEIAYLGIYTSAGDPWSAGDLPTDSTLDLLEEFRLAWNGSGWPAEADLAHILSGANLGGGIAYVDVLCSQVYGFGVSANLGGNIDWGSFNGSSGPLTWDFVVVAHELGHNFGARHTHDYCPPLDSCSSNCNGSSGCGRSTIMSYCHACGGMSNIDLRFHALIAEEMRDEMAASCLGEAELQPGSAITFELSFDPVSGSGSKSAELSFTHDAVNMNSPFLLDLSGTAQN